MVVSRPQFRGHPVNKIVVITGAGAGVGRATVAEFARHGCAVALLSRDRERLEAAVQEARNLGVRALAVPTDVADADAVEAAATRVEDELGPIDIWVNAAMATVFAPVSKLTAAEVRRGTEVTYLGQVHGMMAALRRMTPRNRGAIVNVGSALAYRSVPLQSVYCGAKFAIRGFTDSLRSEILHDKLAITISMVDLPAINTPQFDWALNKTGCKARPVPPVFQPEVAAREIVYAAFHPRRQMWIGWPTVKAIIANRIVPGLLDRYLAGAGYTGQLTDEPVAADAPNNLFQPVPGKHGAHGRFDGEARGTSWEALASRHRDVMWAAIVLGAAAGFWRLSRRIDIRVRR
jgi:short-subunit dehydrogenase